ncbi:MAG: SPFH domain-containing protein [Phycisphaerae bacterium]
MLKHIGIYLISIVVVGGLLANTIFDPVDYDEIHVLRTFGKTTAVWDGKEDSGLHLKWPWPVQSVTVYDRKLQTFEVADLQTNTKDDMSIIMSVSIAWRIDEPERFIRSPETMAAAEEALGVRLMEKMDQATKTVALSDLVNVEAGKLKIKSVSDGIQKELNEQVMRDFGITVPLVRINRLGLAKNTTETVINTIVEERRAAASRYRSEGEARATAIRERAKTSKEMILAFARRKAGEIRAKGEEASARYYEQFDKAPEFGIFLREIEALEESLRGRTLLIVNDNFLPVLRYFRMPPSSESLKAAAEQIEAGLNAEN